MGRECKRSCPGQLAPAGECPVPLRDTSRNKALSCCWLFLAVLSDPAATLETTAGISRPLPEVDSRTPPGSLVSVGAVGCRVPGAIGFDHRGPLQEVDGPNTGPTLPVYRENVGDKKA